MSSETILKAIAEEQPLLMAKIAMALKMTEAIDPDFADDTVRQFEVITEYTTEKVAAGWGDWGKGVAAMGASTLIGTVASDLYDVAKRGLTSSGNFNRVMESNDALKEYDKKDVRKAFDTLHRYAPEFTADPSVGGQLIHNMLQTPLNQHNLIKEFIGARKNLRDVRKSQFGMGNVAYEAPDDYATKHEWAKKMEDLKHGRATTREDVGFQRQKSLERIKADSSKSLASHKARVEQAERLKADSKHNAAQDRIKSLEAALKSLRSNPLTPSPSARNMNIP